MRSARGWASRSAAVAMAAMCAGVLALLAAFGASEAQSPRRIALLVGNAAYDETVGPLRNPGADVAAVRAALLQAGFAAGDIVTVENANQRQLDRAVGAFATRAAGLSSSDVAFFYYSGHGAVRAGTSRLHLIPTDATDPDDASFWVDTISFDSIVERFNGAGSDAAWILAVDACRDELRVPNRSLGDGDKGFVNPPSANGMLIAFAADERQTAKDVWRGSSTSPYAAALATHLTARGRSILDVFQAVRVDVVTRTGGVQSPVTVSRLNATPVLVPGEPTAVTPPGPAPAADPLQAVFDRLAAPCEYALFARDHPGSALAGLARSRAAGAPPCDEAQAQTERVRQAQSGLIAMGCLTGAADGVAGQLTTAAVSRFREARGLGAGGIDDALVAAVARAATEGFSCRPAPSQGPAPVSAPTPTPADPAAAARLAAERGLAVSQRVFRDCAECPEMVAVPSGTFLMGSPSGEAGRDGDEGPQRSVTISPSFAVGRFEVTWSEWEACVRGGGCDGSGPAGAGGDEGWGTGTRPVINVDWNSAQSYVRWLSQKTGASYRLLSEAEWEYAARAGNSGRWTFGDIEARLGDYAWYRANSGGRTQPVGGKSANAFGLHDMHGNVWEWVEDCYADSFAGAPSDGGAVTTGDCSLRVLRGGSWISVPQDLRSAIRYWSTPAIRDDFFGFRLARTL